MTAREIAQRVLDDVRRVQPIVVGTRVVVTNGFQAGVEATVSAVTIRDGVRYVTLNERPPIVVRSRDVWPISQQGRAAVSDVAALVEQWGSGLK